MYKNYIKDRIIKKYYKLNSVNEVMIQMCKRCCNTRHPNTLILSILKASEKKSLIFDLCNILGT